MEKDNIKYLGVIIDSHLKWKKHISTVSKKISRCIGIMCKLKQFINVKNIYYSLLYSHLVYAIQVWGSACISEIHKILVLRKRALTITRNDTFLGIGGHTFFYHVGCDDLVVATDHKPLVKILVG